VGPPRLGPRRFERNAGKRFCDRDDFRGRRFALKGRNAGMTGVSGRAADLQRAGRSAVGKIRRQGSVRSLQREGLAGSIQGQLQLFHWDPSPSRGLRQSRHFQRFERGKGGGTGRKIQRGPPVVGSTNDKIPKKLRSPEKVPAARQTVPSGRDLLSDVPMPRGQGNARQRLQRLVGRS